MSKFSSGLLREAGEKGFVGGLARIALGVDGVIYKPDGYALSPWTVRHYSEELYRSPLGETFVQPFGGHMGPYGMAAQPIAVPVESRFKRLAIAGWDPRNAEPADTMREIAKVDLIRTRRSGDLISITIPAATGYAAYAEARQLYEALNGSASPLHSGLGLEYLPGGFIVHTNPKESLVQARFTYFPEGEGPDRKRPSVRILKDGHFNNDDLPQRGITYKIETAGKGDKPGLNVRAEVNLPETEGSIPDYSALIVPFIVRECEKAIARMC